MDFLQSMKITRGCTVLADIPDHFTGKNIKKECKVVDFFFNSTPTKQKPDKVYFFILKYWRDNLRDYRYIERKQDKIYERINPNTSKYK